MIDIRSIKGRMFTRFYHVRAGFEFSSFFLPSLISLELDSLRISPRSRPFLPFTCIQFFPEAAYINFYRDSDANSKDRRARSPPSPWMRMEREVLLLELGFFQRRRKAGGREACVKRDASRDSFATKRHGKIVEYGANLRGGSSAKRDKSRGYAFSGPFKSREWSCRG